MQASEYPPLRKNAKERDTRFIGDIGEIERLGHPPLDA
jgi:hypothetical protein